MAQRGGEVFGLLRPEILTQSQIDSLRSHAISENGGEMGRAQDNAEAAVGEGEEVGDIPGRLEDFLMIGAGGGGKLQQPAAVGGDDRSLEFTVGGLLSQPEKPVAYRHQFGAGLLQHPNGYGEPVLLKEVSDGGAEVSGEGILHRQPVFLPLQGDLQTGIVRSHRRTSAIGIQQIEFREIPAARGMGAEAAFRQPEAAGFIKLDPQPAVIQLLHIDTSFFTMMILALYYYCVE